MTVKSLTHRALVSTLVLAPMLACGVDSQSPDSEPMAGLEQEMPTADELVADAEYMRELFEEREDSRALAIDLGDDQQYRFLINRLRSAGLDSSTAPELMGRVERARLRAMEDLVPRTTDRCDLFVTNQEADEGTLSTIGRSSCVDGSDYSFLQVCHYDSFGSLIDCSVAEEFGGGIAADVFTDTVIPEGYADGVSYQLSATTEEFYYYVMPLTATSGTELRLNMQHPVNQVGGSEVLVCLERSTDSTDCDYKHAYAGTCTGNALCSASNQTFPVRNADGSGTYDDTNLYMPLQTSTGFSHVLPSNGSVINSARAWLTLRTPGTSTPAGGLCTADFTSASSYLQIVPVNPNQPNGLKKLVINPFALDMGNALWPDHCVDHRTEVDLHVEINVQTGLSSRTYAFSSASGTGFGPISIAWGCLPPGTPITLADGMEVPIERIVAGDKVLADDDGGVLTVVDVMRGDEDEPLVVVEDSLGHVVEMTATHPVPTLGRGALEARELQLGDRLETDDGVAHVVSVTRKDYDGPVWNLVLGTPEELEARGTATTMVANHVVVGDSRMQGVIKAERTAAAEAARAEAPIPPELYVDYVGAQLRGLLRK